MLFTISNYCFKHKTEKFLLKSVGCYSWSYSATFTTWIIHGPSFTITFVGKYRENDCKWALSTKQQYNSWTSYLTWTCAVINGSLWTSVKILQLLLPHLFCINHDEIYVSKQFSSCVGFNFVDYKIKLLKQLFYSDTYRLWIPSACDF